MRTQSVRLVSYESMTGLREITLEWVALRRDRNDSASSRRIKFMGLQDIGDPEMWLDCHNRV